MTLKSTLDKWATDLSTKAAQNDTPLQESTDAFKAVTAYYLVQQKIDKKHPENEDELDDDGKPKFSFAQEVVNGSPGQRAQVRAGRNS